MTRLVPLPRAARTALLGATALAGLAILSPATASAGQFPVAIGQSADPLLQNLSIPANAAQVGMWSGVQNWPIVPIHASLLPSGKLVTYGSPQGQAVQDGRTYDIWDPTQGFGGGHTLLPGLTSVNSFCSAQALQTTGSLLMSGGIFNNGIDKGSAVLNAAATGVSALRSNMADDRYYASMITQADGSQVIMGGTYPYAAGWSAPQDSINNGQNTGMTPEVYRPGSGWTSLFGVTSRDAFGPDNSRYWYPRAWVAPNGKIFGISSDNLWYLDTTGSGTLTFSHFKSGPIDTSTAKAPNTGPGSTAALYDKGKILQVGGNSMTNFDGLYAASRAATVFDITGATVKFRDTAPMTYARDWATATVLPTGKVLVTGGSAQGDSAGSSAVLAPETWDPATGQWTVGPPEAVYRGYHSNALLLQDGAVMVSGGGIPGPVDNFNAEVFYPPYLFTTVNGQAQLAPRPQIVSLSSNAIAYNLQMQIEMTTGAAIGQVVLVGLSEVTHSFNSGQRRYPTAFTQSGTVLTARMPASGNDAPPGYYQVVVIDANGVPSPGAIIALGAGTAAPGTQATQVAAVAQDLTGLSKCADENGTCTFTGTQAIKYGANGIYTSKTATGTVACSNATFGDPNSGFAKDCYVASSAVAGNAGGAGGPGASAGGNGPSPGGSGPSPGATGNVTTAAGTGGWTPIGVQSQQVATGSDGTTVVINSADNSVWEYLADNSWKQLPGKMTSVAVRNARSIWGVGTDANVYRFDGSAWTFAGPYASTVTVSSDGLVALTNPSNEIWFKTTDDTQSGWTEIPNRQARRVAAMNAHSLWTIGMDSNVYRTDMNNNWAQVGVTTSSIAASSDGTVLVTNANDQTIWQKTGDDTNSNWSSLGTLAALAVAAPGSGRAVVVGLDQNVYRR